MSDSGLNFTLLFWGVWLLIPIIVDGSSIFSHLWFSMYGLDKKPPPPLSKDLPQVTVVIPAYNEQIDINYCLLALRAQTYPHHLLHIIVVDDGSQDDTVDVVHSHMDNCDSPALKTSSFTLKPRKFTGVIELMRVQRDSTISHGKASAVNMGLTLARGQLIVCIDSDVVLEPQAIEHAVRAFIADPKLLAATGHLIIDPYLVTEIDEEGIPRVDDQGRFIPRPLTASERTLTACQFLEYVNAFHMARRSESFIDSMFTISGACGIFRAEAFKTGGQYSERTVSEDTDMTLSLHSIPNSHLGYLPTVRAHLAPVLTWSSLYAQRVRWQRGALEVSAIYLNPEHRPETKWLFWNVILPWRLQVNHTMALPRLIWLLMIWMLTLFGYSWEMIAQVFGLLYVLYFGINTVSLLAAYVFSPPPEKVYTRLYMGRLIIWPVYNIFLFCTRVSAEIRTLTERAQWTVSMPLLIKIESTSLRSTARSITRYFRG